MEAVLRPRLFSPYTTLRRRSPSFYLPDFIWQRLCGGILLGRCGSVRLRDHQRSAPRICTAAIENSNDNWRRAAASTTSDGVRHRHFRRFNKCRYDAHAGRQLPSSLSIASRTPRRRAATPAAGPHFDPCCLPKAASPQPPSLAAGALAKAPGV
jgi:hypothetical protein